MQKNIICFQFYYQVSSYDMEYCQNGFLDGKNCFLHPSAHRAESFHNYFLRIPELNSFVHLSCLILASCSRINNFLVIWIVSLTMEITTQSQAAWWTHYLGCLDVVPLRNRSKTRHPRHILWGELMSSTILGYSATKSHY